jgi:hypothetical protein
VLVFVRFALLPVLPVFVFIGVDVAIGVALTTTAVFEFAFRILVFVLVFVVVPQAVNPATANESAINGPIFLILVSSVFSKFKTAPSSQPFKFLRRFGASVPSSIFWPSIEPRRALTNGY